MKKSKKSFEELAAEMAVLQETKTGELRGGFTSFSTQSLESKVRADDNHHDCPPITLSDPD